MKLDSFRMRYLVASAGYDCKVNYDGDKVDYSIFDLFNGNREGSIPMPQELEKGILEVFDKYDVATRPFDTSEKEGFDLPSLDVVFVVDGHTYGFRGNPGVFDIVNNVVSDLLELVDKYLV